MCFAINLLSCHSSNDKGSERGKYANEPAPVKSPAASMRSMQIEKGLSVKLVAAEPLVRTPVAMAFDDSLRLWVVEMSDYQPIEEERHNLPTGKIVILTDRDGDGIMDERKVFLDSLAMPRAICLVGNGVLIAVPPYLWYVIIDHDRPGKKVIVDSSYTVSGNPEGQTNGLLRSLDNWIYSAGFGSSKRYRRIDGKWQTEKTRIRGQWGISQNDYGNLFYNNNSQNLLGDYFFPGLAGGNKWQKKVAGYNQKIVPDNRVYPVRPTPGVNRGYRQGVLDDSLRLEDFTAACGPLIYRGGLLGAAYSGNAFVCEPAANLIKRNILNEQGYRISGRQAYHNKEFLASTDERFRPVNLYDGPDGALYVVDMYRGIIQDKLSLTEYLKKYVISHKLYEPVNCGRIYKIVPNEKKGSLAIIPKESDKLVALLKSPNGWIRDRVQQRLVEGRYVQAVPALRALLFQKDYPLATIHALWTLEGLHALRPSDLLPLMKDTDSHICMEALSAAAVVMSKGTYRQYLPLIRKMITEKDTVLAPYVAYVVNCVWKYDVAESENLLTLLIAQYCNDAYVTGVILGGLGGREALFLKKVADTTTIFYHSLRELVRSEVSGKKIASVKKLKKKYPKGYAMFNTICQTCHGSDGNGIKFMAPPLNGSDWVTGDKNKLISIVLYGLTGTIEVGGRTYKKPEVIGDMPGFGNNEEFSDSTVAELTSFIRNAWGNRATELHQEDVADVRRRLKDRQKSLTMDELNELFPR